MNASSAYQPLPPPSRTFCTPRAPAASSASAGETHTDDDTIALATITRMKGYLVGHPGHQFVVDEDAGIIAVVIAPALNASGPVQVLAQSGDLLQLIHDIGAPSAEDLL